MKSLTKVKIINWHYFWNETVDIKPIVFLTGLNASGKSTFIDALQVVLLGDTSGRNFNKAALEKSARTLKGYLRGEIGDTEDGGFKYLRNGRFTSYIVLEFYDDLNSAYFTVGCVFDSFEEKTEEHRFFILDNAFPENEFINNKIPMSYSELNEFFQKNYNGKYKFLETNKAYQEMIKVKFGGLKDKYFNLLKRSTSFIPITDITTFITEYVCDPQMVIDVSGMQDNILQYKILEKEANTLIQRISLLEQEEDVFEKYFQSKTNILLSSYVIDKAQVQIQKDLINSYYSQIESFKKRLVEIEAELLENNSSKNELNRKKNELILDKANNDTYKLTEQLYQEKQDLEEKIASLERVEKDTTTSLSNYGNTFLNISNSLIKTFATIDIDLLDEAQSSEIIELSNILVDVSTKSQDLLNSLSTGLKSISIDLLSSWRETLFEFKQHLSAFCVSFARSIRNLENKINVLKMEKNSLNDGVKSYSSELSGIKNELKERLSKKYGKNIEVSLFADLIDIKNKEWINAIEGFLNNQKFNLFVAPEYYHAAYDILKELLLRYHFYGTALVDQEKLIAKGYVCENNSLAEEISTSHEGARAYSNFLIGRLRKCNSIEEIRSSGNGITPECDLYRNFALTKINPRLYMQSFIGRSVGARQLQEKADQIATTIMTLTNYRSLYKVINEANANEIINTNEINTIISDINSTYDLIGTKKSLSYIDIELSKHDTLQIESIDRRLKAIEEDITTIEEEGKQLLIEKGNIITSINNLKDDKIKNEEKKLKDITKNLNDNYDQDFIKNVGDPEMQRLTETKSLVDIVTEYSIVIGRAQYVTSNLFSQVKKLRKEYCDYYHLSYDIDLDNNDVYLNELIDMRDVKLPEYKIKIEDSYNKATKQFKDDFISKLRSQIETVEDQISDLNNALSASTFGDDSYRFTCKANPTFKKYYDMFKDDLLLKQGEDDSEFVDKYNDVMQDLFQQIISEDANAKVGNAAIGISTFTDYKSYLDFDLIVTNKYGVEQRLSKMIKKKSGGETQTPFYISVLASFAQLYHVNDSGELGNTIRLIIFDEAFSKMDRGRIKESINLLRKFNLQAILSAPSEKVSDISEEVDETLVVLHGKNSSSIRLYSKQ